MSDFSRKPEKGLDLFANPRLNPKGDLTDEIHEMRLLSLDQVKEILGLGKYSLMRLVESNRLRTVRIGHRRLVSMKALREYIDELETYARKEGNYG